MTRNEAWSLVMVMILTDPVWNRMVQCGFDATQGKSLTAQAGDVAQFFRDLADALEAPKE